MPKFACPPAKSAIFRWIARATIGQIGNIEQSTIKIGQSRVAPSHGLAPGVRGVAMNPRDHPHGGGEGKTGIGMPGPKTPWGKPALGYRTRKNARTDKYIVRRRGKK